MNISSGISQIIYQTRLPGKILLQKAYVWPGYNAGEVAKIPSLNERSEHNLNYIKRSSFDSIKESFAGKINNTGYNSKGNLINIKTHYTAGSIFEALA